MYSSHTCLKVICSSISFICTVVWNYLTMMMESVFSFLPSYCCITFSAKGKISKSVKLFLSHIGPKWCWPVGLQDFKSNISLEQSNEIVYIFKCCYQKLRIDRKILGWLWPEMVVAILVWRRMDERMDELSWFFMLMQIQSVECLLCRVFASEAKLKLIVVAVKLSSFL